MKQQFSHSSSHKNEFQNIVFRKNVSLSVLSLLCSFFLCSFSYFSHLKAHCIIEEELKQDFRKQLIQLRSDTNKLIRLNLKSAYNSSVLYFPKLFLTKFKPFMV